MKYEYSFVGEYVHDSFMGTINALGAEGWRVCSFLILPPGKYEEYYVALLEREAMEKEERC